MTVGWISDILIETTFQIAICTDFGQELVRWEMANTNMKTLLTVARVQEASTLAQTYL